MYFYRKTKQKNPYEVIFINHQRKGEYTQKFQKLFFLEEKTHSYRVANIWKESKVVSRFFSQI